MSVKQDSKPGSAISPDFAPRVCAEDHCTEDQSELSHAARIAAKFVIERWQDGSRRHCANLNLPHSQSAKARWFEKTQQGLQDWIKRGGFSLPVDAHDAAALSGAVEVRPILYRLSGDRRRCDRSCVGQS